jgi:SHS2 domain-containing protein
VFADVTHVAVSACVPFHLPPDGDEDLLLALLEEVLYLLDAEGVIPVNATITTAAEGGLQGEFLVAPAAAVDQHGAVPKAISYHGLELREDAGTWQCRVTVDV